jgi:uncharacterized protein YgbK (DUF1537 family)
VDVELIETVEPKNVVPVALIAPYAEMTELARKLEKQRCLIIADDLTGGADAGVQFAKRGLKTLLLPYRGEGSVPLAAHPAEDVLVVNTISRGQSPAQAAGTISTLLKGFAPRDFPILYKKIDSTLRGNIGAEIDALLAKTALPLCFMAPSYPEQSRFLKAGIMMVGRKPIALTEAAADAASPVRESNVVSLLARQASLPIGRIDWTDVASGKEALRRAVERERKAGRRIIVFDAVSRRDLAAIAEVAFAMERMPLLAGSAGLAGEIARRLAPAEVNPFPEGKAAEKTFRHLFIISGSASAVARRQWERLAETGHAVFELPRSFLDADGGGFAEERRRLAGRIGSALTCGCVIFRTVAERLSACGNDNIPVHQRIGGLLADVAVAALEGARLDARDLVLILTGGDTALSVLQRLDPAGLEIEGELPEGSVRGRLRGGEWDGLVVVTKAGAFGQEDALLRIVERLIVPAQAWHGQGAVKPAETTVEDP